MSESPLCSRSNSEASISSKLSVASKLSVRSKLSGIDKSKAMGIMQARTDLSGDRCSIDQLIDLTEEVPEVLLENVFDAFQKTISTQDFKDSDTDERTRATAIDSVLQTISDHFIRKYKMKKAFELKIKLNPSIDYTFQNVSWVDKTTQRTTGPVTVKGSVDYEMLRSENEDNPDYYLVGVAKATNPIDGLQQCGVYMKRLELMQNEKKALFGLLSDGINWILVKLENGSFKLSHDYTLEDPSKPTIARDYDPEVKKRWVADEDRTLLVKIIYNLLHKGLAPIYEPISSPPAKKAKTC